MKKIILLFMVLTSTLFYAQTSGITYQAVIYNPNPEILPGNNHENTVLSNQDICIRFSIKDVLSSLEYQETQMVKTDEFGMVNLLVGEGNRMGGYAANFDAILWNSSAKKLQVEMDVSGTCANFLEVSDQNFSAVPFAYASKTAENISGIVPITNGGTGATTVAGAKTNLGLNNIDNTSDANKPVSLATQTALDLKENAANKSTATTLGTSDVLFPTQNAVKTYVDNQISSGVADATNSVKGKIQLAGDLGGTADLPTVPALANKENTIAAGTITEYFRGDKTWQTLDKSAVGLENVENTADMDKPVATAVQTALNAKENTTNKSAVTTLGTSDVLFPTQRAVKTYVDTQINANTIPDATTTLIGKIQLAGDLGGTGSSATNPVISNNAVTTAKLADASVTNAKIGAIISVNKGGSGSDMSTTSGYVKQATNGANFTTVAKIPVVDVDGAVRSVNGIFPATNGNVSVLIGRVFTGISLDPNASSSITGATPAIHESDIYVVSETGNINNGRTFIYDGTNWIEVASNFSTSDARYLNVSGDTMEGNLTVPTGQKLIIADLPTNATDAVNKTYADTKMGGSGTTNFVPKFTGTNPSITLSDSSIFDNGSNVGIGTNVPLSKFSNADNTSNFVSSNNSFQSSNGISWLTSTGGYTTSLYNSLNSAGANGLQVKVANASNQTVAFEVGQNAALSSPSNPLFNVLGNGYVGIGTSSPTSRFSNTSTQIIGSNGQSSSSPTGFAWANNTVGWGAALWSDYEGLNVKVNKLTSSIAFEVGSGTASQNDNVGAGGSTSLLKVLTNGNVGIGTSAPTSLLHLVTPSSARMLFETTNGSSGQASIDLKVGSYQWWRMIGQGSLNGGRFDIWNQNLNSSAMSILPSNYIGIGTQTPTAQLEVAASTGLGAIIKRYGNTTYSGANLILQKTYGTGATSHGAGIVNGDYVGRILFSASNGSSYLTNGTDIVGYAAGTQSATNNGGGIFFRTVPQNSVEQSVERMRIDENGRVGIGTTSTTSPNPTNTLDVVGGFTLRNTAGTWPVAGGYGIEFNTSASSPRMDWVANGNYIGQFSSVGNDFFLRNSLDNSGNIRFWTKTSGNGSERLTILNNGNIGIGTITPAAQLHTTGTVRFEGAGTPAAGKVLTSDASGNATWQNVVGSTSVASKTANFNLAPSDNAGFIVVDSPTTIEVTVPATLPAGFYCQIIQQGVGQVKVVSSGVTMNSALGFYSRTQGSSIGIMMATPTIGFVSGDTGL